jgi:putative transposase
MRVLIRPDWAGDSTMKRTRHTAEQIIRKLKTAEQLIAQGKTVADVCRVIEVTQPIYHRLRQQYGGMQAEEARRLTQLEKENARLCSTTIYLRGALHLYTGYRLKVVASIAGTGD